MSSSWSPSTPGLQVTALPEAASSPPDAAPPVCCVCGSHDLYGQRDFNRTLGLTLAAIGLALGPLTSWISTIVAVVLDAGLFLIVPTVAVCYACNAQYRGFARPRAPKPFEIAIHDAYKFGKRFPPRRDVAVADPRPGLNRSKGDNWYGGGHFGVVPWAAATGAVSAAAGCDNGHWSVADPRLPGRPSGWSP